MYDKLEALKSKVEESQFIPTGISVLRAGVSVIPVIGGALDHLIFDKADVIKSKNIQRSIDEIAKKIECMSEEHLTKEWFESTEALEMFRQLIDKVQFEADDTKIQTIANIYAVSGTNEFSSNPNKITVLRKASELSSVQKEVFIIISEVQKNTRKFTFGSIESEATAIWFNDVKEAVKKNPKGKFWQGTLNLNVEIDILESLNLLRKPNALLANELGYELTALGELLIRFLKA